MEEEKKKKNAVLSVLSSVRDREETMGEERATVGMNAGNSIRTRLSKDKQSRPKHGKAARVRERVVFVCLFVFVHVRKTSVGMFILKLQYVQVFTYRMLTIKYYILRVMLMRHDTFCTTFSLFEQRFVPMKCQTSGKKEQKSTYMNYGEVSMLKFARLFCPVLVIF